MMICADCGHRTSNDWVAMADECPQCKTTPFNEKEE